MRAMPPYLRTIWFISVVVFSVLLLHQLGASAQGLVGDPPGGAHCRCESPGIQTQELAMHLVLVASVCTAVCIGLIALGCMFALNHFKVDSYGLHGPCLYHPRLLEQSKSSTLAILIIVPLLVYLFGAQVVANDVPVRESLDAWRFEQALARGELLGLSKSQVEDLIKSIPTHPCVRNYLYVNGKGGALMGEWLDPETHYHWSGWAYAEVEFDDAGRISRYNVCLAGHPFDAYSEWISSKLDAWRFVFIEEPYMGGQPRLQRILAFLP